MIRIILSTLAIFLFLTSLAVWAEELSQPQDQGPSQDTTQPVEPAQPQTTPAPQGTTPANPQEQAPQSSTPPAGPAQPEATQPTPGEKPSSVKQAETTLKATEEEKKKPVASAQEQAQPSIISGRLELSVTETYSHSSSNQLYIQGFGILPILIIGDAEVQRIRSDSFTTSFNVSYKVSPDLGVGLNIPYTYTLVRVSSATGIVGRTTVSPNVDRLSRAQGVGDLSGSVSYHLLTEKPERPNLTVGMGFRGRTARDAFETKDATKNPPLGSGFNALSVSLNASKTAEPAVVYGSLSFSRNLPRHHVVLESRNPPALINLAPGPGIGFGFGMAYALNYKLTINMGYSQSFNFPNRLTGPGVASLPHNKLPNSATNAAALRFGAIWKINEKTLIDLSVSPGLTLDAPDVQISLRIPYRF